MEIIENKNKEIDPVRADREIKESKSKLIHFLEMSINPAKEISDIAIKFRNGQAYEINYFANGKLINSQPVALAKCPDKVIILKLL